jgi:pyridoxine kinase
VRVRIYSARAWLVSTPQRARTFTGSGDVTAATFLAALLRLQDLPRALAHTAAVIYGLLAATDTLGRSELALIAAQDEFIRPSHSFEVLRLR